MSVERIIEGLQQVSGVHDTLLELAERKRNAVTKNDVDELTRITGAESKQLKEIARLETELKEASIEVLRSKGMTPVGEITISFINKLIFQADQKKQISRLQQELTDKIALLKERNALNKELIQQSLAFIDYALDLYVASPEQDVVYGRPDGQGYGGAKGPGFFDSRA